MAAQLVKGRVRELQIEFSGSFPIDPDPIATAVSKGFLEPFLSEAPNYINATAIAKERDIRISKVTASRSRGYTTHVLVTAVSTDEVVSLGGTVLGESPRVVSIDAFPIEIRPEGTMLICTNYDRPGAVGRVGTVLGNAEVNISSMQLGRIGEDNLAMFVLTLDTVPPDDVLAALRNMTDVIHSLKMVRL
jgi:D-3-phosphoglycerate dehydrogenase